MQLDSIFQHRSHKSCVPTEYTSGTRSSAEKARTWRTGSSQGRRGISMDTLKTRRVRRCVDEDSHQLRHVVKGKGTSKTITVRKCPLVKFTHWC